MKTEQEIKTDKKNHKDENRDTITGAPGAHPVGTGVGATGGALAGAAIGAVAGPVGTSVGLVAGAIAGGLAGKGVAEGMDPSVEDAHWKSNFSKQDYVADHSPYTMYETAYRTGYEGHAKYPGKTFDEVESELERDYANARGDESLSWEKAKPAIRDAWNRGESNTGVIVAGDKPRNHGTAPTTMP